MRQNVKHIGVFDGFRYILIKQGLGDQSSLCFTICTLSINENDAQPRLPYKLT